MLCFDLLKDFSKVVIFLLKALHLKSEFKFFAFVENNCFLTFLVFYFYDIKELGDLKVDCLLLLLRAFIYFIWFCNVELFEALEDFAMLFSLLLENALEFVLHFDLLCFENFDQVEFILGRLFRLELQTLQSIFFFL